jgi:hypothetical protein
MTGCQMALSVFIAIIIIVPIIIHIWHPRKVGDTVLEGEFKRWSEWARALLITLPVLLVFDGVLLGDNRILPWAFFGGTLGLVGTVWVVSWHAKEGFWEDKKGRPLLLWLGSICFGIQAMVSIMSLVIKLID